MREWEHSLMPRLFLRNGDDVDLVQHAGPRELSDIHQRAGRLRRGTEDLAAAFQRILKVADVGNVGRRLVDIVQGGALLLEGSLDLLPGIEALTHEVADVEDLAAARRGLVLGADPAEEDDPSGVRDSYHLRE